MNEFKYIQIKGFKVIQGFSREVYLFISSISNISDILGSREFKGIQEISRYLLGFKSKLHLGKLRYNEYIKYIKDFNGF